MKPRLFYNDIYEFPLPLGHKFPLAKYKMLRDTLAAEDLFTFEVAPLASAGLIELVHGSDYVQSFLNGRLELSAMRRIGFPWSQELVTRTLASVGGTCAAAGDAIANGWGGALAGGTHHAFRDEGAGYCVFNDIAVAISSLVHDGSIRRAAVLDLDVHQGDGTASLFAEDPNILTTSIHGSSNFPFRKQQSNIDVGLPDGTEDASYLSALQEVLAQVLRFNPDVVFYQAGVDGLREDRLGRLALTHAGLQARDTAVFSACAGESIPCVITLGGGYADPISLTVEAHAATFRTAARVFTRSEESS